MGYTYRQYFSDYVFDAEKPFSDLKNLDMVEIYCNTLGGLSYVGKIYFSDYKKFRIELEKLFDRLNTRGYYSDMSDFWFNSPVFIKLFKDNGGFYPHYSTRELKYYYKKIRSEKNEKKLSVC